LYDQTIAFFALFLGEMARFYEKACKLCVLRAIGPCWTACKVKKMLEVSDPNPLELEDIIRIFNDDRK
jgi:hypothetical protein